jgi:uncharacterized FlaG/YvyC family protein
MGVPVSNSALSALSIGEIPHNQDRRVLASAITAIDQSSLWPGRALRIHFDLATQSLTVQVVNSETNEIVDQIPSEEVLRMASELGSGANIGDSEDNTTA